MNRRTRTIGFTLIELSLAMAGAAVIMAAIYGIFSRAVHLRNEVTSRTRAIQVRTHVASVIRNDLRGARISGGALAVSLVGSPSGSPSAQSGNFPGYLRFTTTTARDVDNGDDVANSDLQEVQYYVATDPAAQDSRAGMLVRTVDSSLLAPTRETPPEQPLLAGVESLTVEFYDGNSWQTSWDVSQDPTLPQAIRVSIQPAGPVGSSRKPPAIEVLVPWLTQTCISASVTSQSYLPAAPSAGGTNTPAPAPPTGTGTGAGTGTAPPAGGGAPR